MSSASNASAAREPNLLSEQEYIEELLWIQDKQAKLIPLWLNSTQHLLLGIRERFRQARRPARYMVVKARQLGVTTLEQALSFHGAATVPGYQTVTLAHDDKTTEKIFRIALQFYQQLDEAFRPARRTVNRRELVFPDMLSGGRRQESTFGIATAGSREFGHGLTIHRVHCSEVARWPEPEATFTGLAEAVPSTGEIVIETTPKGAGTWTHELWLDARAGKNEFFPIFLPWFIHAEYQTPLFPGEALVYTGEEAKLVERHHLTPEQIKWRRAKRLRLKHKFFEQYPEDEVSCFLSAGHCIFLPDALEYHAGACEEPIQIVRGAQGVVLIWEQPLPGENYVVGADVAEGLPDGDSSAAVVLNRRTNCQVAAIHGEMSPQDLARGLNTLGHKFNDALVAVERNNHGGTTLHVLKNELRYPNLYEMPDAETGKAKCLGWDTNPRTRPLMVDELAETVDGQHVALRDKDLVGELYSFVRNARGKEEHAAGCHDDRVLALAIALQARRVRVPQYAFNVVQPRRDLGQGRGF